jgi:hypothetical protein
VVITWLVYLIDTMMGIFMVNDTKALMLIDPTTQNKMAAIIMDIDQTISNGVTLAIYDTIFDSKGGFLWSKNTPVLKNNQPDNRTSTEKVKDVAKCSFIHALIHKADIVARYINFNRPT